MTRRGQTSSGIEQRTKVLKDAWVDSVGNVVDQAGNVIISAAAQALVSGDVNRGVVIHGATPAGWAAAIAAARQGKQVTLLSDSDRIGGMVGWGITHQDINVSATPALVAGLSREFLHRVGMQETNNAKDWQRWHRLSCDGRPSWFIRAFNEMLAEQGRISVIYDIELLSVQKSGVRIQGLTFNSPQGVRTLAGRVFVEGHYCGDLVAAAGCDFAIGREANALYGETSNGIRTPTTWTPPLGTALTTLSPYVIAGDSNSGLLPFVDNSGIGTPGAGDGRVMLFTYRMFVTNSGSDRIPFPAPNLAKYNPLHYELLARAMQAQPTTLDTLAEVVTLYQNQINTNYFDLNSRNGISTNYPNQSACREYIEASKARRAEIADDALQYWLGLFHWIKNSGDARIPAGLITNLATYGLAASELQATGGLSPEIYVREGRRVIGDAVFDEGDFTLGNGHSQAAIAFAFYDIDSHMVRIVNDAGVAKLEGSILSAMAPNTAPQLGSPIPYSVLLPKRAQCDNLLCVTAPSMSRVAWASLRMEPILMMMGEAAGVAASLAIDSNIAVQDVATSRLLRITDPYGVWKGKVVSTEGTLYTEGTNTQVLGTWTAESSRAGFIGASGLTAAGRGAAAGTASGATTNTAGYAIGATTINLASAGTGTIVAADYVRFGSDPNRYPVVTGDPDVSNGGSIVIAAPGLMQAIPAAATSITLDGGGAAVFRCAPFIQETGVYAIKHRFAPTAATDPSIARATAVRHIISHAGGISTYVQNQRYTGGKGGDWETVATVTMRAENPAGTVIGGGAASVDFVQMDNSLGTDTVNHSAYRFDRIA